MPDAPKYRISPRAKRVWGKLQDWYGDALDQYGTFPPQDWCEVIDGVDNNAERAALSEIRSKHVTFPPRFPEFETIFTKSSRPAVAGPSMQERLHDFVVRTKTLTRDQLDAPWVYLYCGHPGHGGDPKLTLSHPSSDFAVVAVVVPADGDSPGYRVNVEDMQLEVAA